MITSITQLRETIKGRPGRGRAKPKPPTTRRVRLIQPGQTRLTRRVLAVGTIGQVVSYDKLGWLIINFAGAFVRLPGDSPMIEILHERS